jgi:hypothetical protein
MNKMGLLLLLLRRAVFILGCCLSYKSLYAFIISLQNEFDCWLLYLLNEVRRLRLGCAHAALAPT